VGEPERPPVVQADLEGSSTLSPPPQCIRPEWEAWRVAPGRGGANIIGTGTAPELGYRFGAVQVGCWLGWASIIAVAAGLGLEVGVRHRLLLVGLTVAAAAANGVAMIIPWREWLASRAGRTLLDLWCAGLIIFVAVLVIDGSSTFALLLFLTAPFIAVVQVGWRRGFWLAAAAVTCVVVAAFARVSPGATTMRLALVAATVGVALVLVRTIRSATLRADLERTAAREASHRIKNDLQTAVDLLLLGRPDGADAAVFDETAARIRSIAAVHRLLSESTDYVDGGALLRAITKSAPVPVCVEAEPATLDATTAQRLGIVANELITNACRHGAPPVSVRLRNGSDLRLTVENRGGGIENASGGRGGSTGLGLELVRRMVERGLRGSFELSALEAGGIRADVVFPAAPL
jgi:two-component sensor histidine kinase